MLGRKISINQESCSDLKIFDFFKKVKKFYGVELNFKNLKKYAISKVKIRDFEEILNTYDLRLTAIYNFEDFSLSSDNYFKKEFLDNFNQALNFCSRIGCELIILTPSILRSSYKESPKWRIIERTTKRLELLGKIAYKQDIMIGFEYTSSSDSSINNLQDTIEIFISLEGRENLGVVIDTYHFYNANDDFQDVIKIRDNLFLIQLSDVRKKNKENYVRAFPGKGEFDFKNLFRVLSQIYYNGGFSLEFDKHECSYEIFKKFTEFKNKLFSITY
ncbi:MAG: sugar phosphate isomerase/epimerase family protein [Promethearchaeota archaeon]